MRRSPLLFALVALIAVSTGACADARERVDDAASTVTEVSEQLGFCITLARALSGLDQGVTTAQDTAEELLAQVPDHLREDARIVADALRAAADGDLALLEDPDVRAA